MRFLILIFLLIASLAATPARAEEFYVELGRAASEAEAQTMWEELRAKNKALAKYNVYPNQILLADGSFATRVQAGPMVTKNEAQRICNRMYRRKVSCYVIEGFDPKNPETFAADTQKPALSASDFLPWLKPSQPAPAPEPVVIAEPAPVRPPVAKDKASAKVDVAEAIQVPVSNSQESNEVTVGEVAPVATESVSIFGGWFERSGWLSVQPFLDEAAAKKFWKELKGKAPDALTPLSMKLIRPVVSQDIPKVILALGKFESETAAMQFCHDFISANGYLECQFASEPPQGEEAMQSGPLAAATTPAAPATAAQQEEQHSLFWGEVLSERSQDTALEKWEKIRTENDDILVNVRSQITSSMANPGIYVVRIGPMKSKARATKLCKRLIARRVGCTVTGL